MTVSASGTRKKRRKTAANGATCSHSGAWPESNRDDRDSAEVGAVRAGGPSNPLGLRFSLIGIDIPSPGVGRRRVGKAERAHRCRIPVGTARRRAFAHPTLVGQSIDIRFATSPHAAMNSFHFLVR